MARKNVHVVPGANGGWSVKNTGSSRPTKTFGTKVAAESFAKDASKKNGIDVVVHGKDGTIQKIDSHADRRPPKERRSA